jgi:hypothetical protein
MHAIDAAEIERRFTYHRPEGQKVNDHEDTRRLFKRLASELADLLPEGREKSLAFTALEESSFWAHAAVARPAPAEPTG